MNKKNNEAQEKINLIQVYEQNLSALSSQKQNLQAQAMEVESSLNELKTAKKAYKIIGNLMIESDSKNLKKEVEQRNEMLTLRLKSMEKQEETFRKKIEEIQKEVMGELK